MIGPVSSANWTTQARGALVTVCVPVYNGERYLARCLDSVLSQDFTNFTLLIADNASSDGTRDIAESYSAKDGRVRYCRHAGNIGLYGNLNFLLAAATTRYVKLANADDYWAPQMIGAAVAILEQDPTVVLCYPMMVMVDEFDRETARYDYRLHLTDEDRFTRFVGALQGLRLVNQLTGVMRLDVVQHLLPMMELVSSDGMFVAELSLYGKIFQLPEYHYYRRFHERSSSFDRKSRQHELRYVYAAGVTTIRYENWRRHLGLAGRVLLGALPWRTRTASLGFLARRMFWDRAALLKELPIGS